jgi:C-terminal processing protease CtpA/Prc
VLQDSVLYSWKMHLKTKKYYVHLILEEYYEEAFDIIDGLIEHYQGICKCDIIDGNITPDINKSDDPFTYFTDLKNYLMNFLNDTCNFSARTLEIKSDIDDLLRLIDSTLYKLGNLTESIIKSYDDFVYEYFR